jgi:phosphoglycolate phosphatase
MLNHPAPSRTLAGAVIAFDLDGTLVDTAPALLGEQGLPPLPLDAARTLVGRGAKVMIERGFAAAGAPLDEALSRALFKQFIAIYLGRIAHESTPFPGLEAALDALQAQGAILAVCTNKRTDLALALLDALDLTRRFASVVGADQAPVQKPDASHLIAAIERAGGQASHALMIGDSQSDVGAARAAGVPIVLVSFGYTDTPAHQLDHDSLIDSFSELPAEALRLIGR